MIRWLFENRRTGRITVAQFPNLALGIYLVATVARAVIGSGNGAGDALGIVASGALIWWGVDELVRGVNPWRRMLGGGVLLSQAVRLVG